MAATNFTPIILYHTTTASAAPTAGNLNNGELAINITDGKLFYKDNGGTVQVIATKGTGTIGGSNTQVQYNSSGALAGSANFTFNGTTATINTLNLTNALGTAYGGTALTTYTQGDLVYASAANTLAKLGIGANTYILTSTGSVPQWSAPSAVTVSTANNLAGGAAGSVPYQSGAGVTTFLSIGTANQVLTSSGTAPQWSSGLTLTTLVTTGNTTLGDGSGDTLTINGTAVSIPNNLNFDSNTLFIDATNNRVGVNTNGPSEVFEVSNGRIQNSSNNATAFDTYQTYASAFPTNEKYWRTQPYTDGTAGTTILRYQFVNDAYSSASTWMNVTRNGTSLTGVVFNEDSNDADFRIESDGNAHAFFLDGGASTVNINYSTGTQPSGASGVSLQIGVLNNSSQIFHDGTTADKGFVTGTASDDYAIYANTAAGVFQNRLQIVNGGELVINQEALDRDTRIETTSRPHAFFVDASANTIGINNSAPVGDLDVIGSVGVYLSRAGSSNARVLYLKQFNDYGYSFNVDSASTGKLFIKAVNNGVESDLIEWDRTNIGQINYGSAVFNEGGGDYDFRVESDTNGYALFLDAAQSRVYFGGATAPATGAPVLVTNGYAAVDTTTSGASPSTTDILSTARFSVGGAGGNYLTFGAYNDNVTAWIQSSYFVPNTAAYNMVLQPLGGNVGIGRYNTGAKLHVEAAPVNASLQIWQNSRTRASGNYYGVEFRDNADEANANIVIRQQSSSNNAGYMEIYANTGTGGNGLGNGVSTILLAGTAVTVNEGGEDLDFRVESDTNTHALFVDAGNSKVVINSATVQAGAALNVYNGGILNYQQFALSGTTLVDIATTITGGLLVIRDDLNGGTCLVLTENGATPIIVSQSGSNYTTGTPTGTQIKLSAGTAKVQASMASGQSTTIRVMVLICDPD